MASRATKKRKTILKKELISLLNQEITWHRDNPGTSACGDSFESGFIVGLQQAKILVRRMA